MHVLLSLESQKLTNGGSQGVQALGYLRDIIRRWGLVWSDISAKGWSGYIQYRAGLTSGRRCERIFELGLGIVRMKMAVQSALNEEIEFAVDVPEFSLYLLGRKFTAHETVYNILDKRRDLELGLQTEREISARSEMASRVQ